MPYYNKMNSPSYHNGSEYVNNYYRLSRFEAGVGGNVVWDPVGKLYVMRWPGRASAEWIKAFLDAGAGKGWQQIIQRTGKLKEVPRLDAGLATQQISATSVQPGILGSLDDPTLLSRPPTQTQAAHLQFQVKQEQELQPDMSTSTASSSSDRGQPLPDPPASDIDHGENPDQKESAIASQPRASSEELLLSSGIQPAVPRRESSDDELLAYNPEEWNLQLVEKSFKHVGHIVYHNNGRPENAEEEKIRGDVWRYFTRSFSNHTHILKSVPHKDVHALWVKIIKKERQNRASTSAETASQV